MSKEKKSKESLVKVIAITVLVLLSLTLLSLNLFNGNNNSLMGPGMMNRMHEYNNYTLSSGSNFGTIFGGLFYVILQLFWVFIIVAVLIGLFLLTKKALEQNKERFPLVPTIPKGNLHRCPHCGSEISDEFKFCPVCTAKLIEECNKCHRKVLWSWQCCPFCGTHKDIQPSNMENIQKGEEKE